MLENRPMEHEHNPSLIGIGGPVEGALSRYPGSMLLARGDGGGTFVLAITPTAGGQPHQGLPPTDG
jgi:hypothetical protein